LITYVDEADYNNEVFISDEKIRKASIFENQDQEKPSLRSVSLNSLNDEIPVQPVRIISNPTAEKSLKLGTAQAIPLEKLSEKIDLIICLGGDGTLLHISNLFQVY
jgi:NAD kinase